MNGSKLISLDEAVSAVHDGASLTAGGFAHSHQPMAFTRALIRSGRSDLEMMSVAECWVAEFLAAAGRLRRVRFSNFMFEGYGRCRQFSKAVETGVIEVEDHSHWGIVSRLTAGGQGLPFMPMRAMAGTDILNTPGFERPEAKAARVASPFQNEQVSVVSPLRPDFAIIHAARADCDGNVQFFGTTSVIEEQVRAAGQVIITVEEIVQADVIRRNPEYTLIPGFMVDAVVLAPFGSHPTGLYNYYDYDADHLREYYEASHDDQAVRAYLERYVFEPIDHWAYLDLVGISRLLRLRMDPELGYLRRGDFNG